MTSADGSFAFEASLMSTVVVFARVFANGEFQGASPRQKNNQPVYIDPH